MSKIEKLVEEYINASIKHGKCTEDGDYKLANKQYIIIEKSITELKLMEKGIDELENLLEHQSDYVKLWSARYLLLDKEVKAKQTLLSLTKKPGFLGFTAQITLDEWSKGNIH
ncbi:hypothetical protein [Desnuesiella massiliensis]|uniref:hypothetical protein n=1 Tax=Desnuesiella massiliensis TaxID=1650662 RepID=UPI0006E25301|nr:hypothetical protein [Desnuesiella massiliensis]